MTVKWANNGSLILRKILSWNSTRLLIKPQKISVSIGGYFIMPYPVHMHWIASDAIPIVCCCFDAVVAVMTIVVSATAAWNRFHWHWSYTARGNTASFFTYVGNAVHQPTHLCTTCITLLPPSVIVLLCNVMVLIVNLHSSPQLGISSNLLKDGGSLIQRPSAVHSVAE